MGPGDKCSVLPVDNGLVGWHGGWVLTFPYVPQIEGVMQTLSVAACAFSVCMLNAAHSQLQDQQNQGSRRMPALETPARGAVQREKLSSLNLQEEVKLERPQLHLA